MSPNGSERARTEPTVKWNHIDGPMLVCSDGTPHWLTLWERLGLRAGFLTLTQLDKMHNSDPRRG